MYKSSHFQPGKFQPLTLSSVLLICLSLTGSVHAIGSVEAKDLVSTCVYARDIKRFEILNQTTLILHGKQDRVWLNELATRCGGLRKHAMLTLNRYGTQVCANDRIYARSRGADFSEAPISSCRLGSFRILKPEELELLRMNPNSATTERG